jgi:hypothetical protein
MSGELKSENINTEKAPTQRSHHPAKDPQSSHHIQPNPRTPLSERDHHISKPLQLLFCFVCRLRRLLLLSLEPSQRWLNVLLIPLALGLHFPWGPLLLPPNGPLLLTGPPGLKHLQMLRHQTALLSLPLTPLPETPVLESPSPILTVNLFYNYLYKSSTWRKPYFLHKLPAQTVSTNWRNRWPPSLPNSIVCTNNKILP